MLCQAVLIATSRCAQIRLQPAAPVRTGERKHAGTLDPVPADVTERALTGAGLLVRTVDRLPDEESGFEAQQALTARLMLADTRFIDGTAQTAFVDTLLEWVRGLPGVQAAGELAACCLPTMHPCRWSSSIP